MSVFPFSIICVSHPHFCLSKNSQWWLPLTYMHNITTSYHWYYNSLHNTPLYFVSMIAIATVSKWPPWLCLDTCSPYSSQQPGSFFFVRSLIITSMFIWGKAQIFSSTILICHSHIISLTSWSKTCLPCSCHSSYTLLEWPFKMFLACSIMEIY